MSDETRVHFGPALMLGPDPFDPLEAEFRKLETEVRQRECEHKASTNISEVDRPRRYRCNHCGLTWNADDVRAAYDEAMGDDWKKHHAPKACLEDVFRYVHMGPKAMAMLAEIHRAEIVAYQEMRQEEAALTTGSRARTR